MINYTKLTTNEQFDTIERLTDIEYFTLIDTFAIENNTVSAFCEYLDELTLAIIIPNDCIVNYNETLLQCLQVAKHLTDNTDCIFYVAIEDDCIVINSVYNVNHYL